MAPTPSEDLTFNLEEQVAKAKKVAKHLIGRFKVFVDEGIEQQELDWHGLWDFAGEINNIYLTLDRPDTKDISFNLATCPVADFFNSKQDLTKKDWTMGTLKELQAVIDQQLPKTPRQKNPPLAPAADQRGHGQVASGDPNRSAANNQRSTHPPAVPVPPEHLPSGNDGGSRRPRGTATSNSKPPVSGKNPAQMKANTAVISKSHPRPAQTSNANASDVSGRQNSPPQEGDATSSEEEEEEEEETRISTKPPPKMAATTSRRASKKVKSPAVVDSDVDMEQGDSLTATNRRSAGPPNICDRCASAGTPEQCIPASRTGKSCRVCSNAKTGCSLVDKKVKGKAKVKEIKAEVKLKSQRSAGRHTVAVSSGSSSGPPALSLSGDYDKDVPTILARLASTDALNAELLQRVIAVETSNKTIKSHVEQRLLKVYEVIFRQSVKTKAEMGALMQVLVEEAQRGERAENILDQIQMSVGRPQTAEHPRSSSDDTPEHTPPASRAVDPAHRRNVTPPLNLEQIYNSIIHDTPARVSGRHDLRHQTPDEDEEQQDAARMRE